MEEEDEHGMSGKLWDFIRLLSEHPTHRKERTMIELLPWFRTRCHILRRIETGALMELMRNSSYFGVQKYDVIFMQGQPRQHSNMDQLRFFIILRGSCSMYVNPFLALTADRVRTRMSGFSGIRSPEKVMMTSSVTPKPDRPDSYAQLPVFDDDISDISEVETDISIDARDDARTVTMVENASTTMPTPGSRRVETTNSRFGRFVVKYEKGRYFGEGALLNEDRMCTATMVADDDCDFLIIPNDYFQHCIKEHYDREVTDQFEFVEEHPFFKELSNKAQGILQISLKKENLDAGAMLLKQGQPMKAVFFIVSGSVDLTIEPRQHKDQFPHLWPFETSSDVYYREFDWLRGNRRKAYQEKYVQRGETSNRRKLTEDRGVRMCTIEAREALGIIEFVMDLKTYIQSARCLTDTEVYVLSLKSLKRVINPKKSTSAGPIDVLKAYTQLKLEYRLSNPISDQIPLLQCLYHEFLKDNRGRSLKFEARTKPLEKLAERERQLLEAVEWFKLGKAPLVLQRDPTVIPMKENMKKKALEREHVRQVNPSHPRYVRRGCLRMKGKREPRSILQLKMDPFADILAELEKSGIWKTPQELEEFLLNYSRTPEQFDLRSQTNKVSENELYLVQLRRERNKLIRRFVALMEQGADPVGLTHEETVMCQVLFDHVTDIDDDEEWETERLPAVADGRSVTSIGRKSFASSYKSFQFVERRGVTPGTLDMRIKDFHFRCGAHDNDVRHLPQLRRFREFEKDESPRPGGKVFVTKAPCLSCRKKVTLKNHRHVHCQMLSFRH